MKYLVLLLLLLTSCSYQPNRKQLEETYTLLIKVDLTCDKEGNWEFCEHVRTKLARIEDKLGEIK